MDCEKALHRMYRYLDGEVTVWRRWAITRHLDRCLPCADGFDYEVEFRQIIATRCRDEMPEDVKRRIAAVLGCDPDVTRQADVTEHEGEAQP